MKKDEKNPLQHSDGHISGSPATFRIYQRKLEEQESTQEEKPKRTRKAK